MRVSKTFLVVVMLIGLLGLTSAVNVGVSPATAVYKDVLRGGYAERPLTVTIDSDIETEIEVEIYGNIADWINYTSKTLSVSKGKPIQLMVSVSPPSDTPNGNYTGFLRIKSSRLGSGKEGQATGIVIPVLDVEIITEVTDQEFLECQASNFKISNAEEGDDIILTLGLENKGNIRIAPKVTLDIWDQTSTILVDQKELFPEEITPTQKSDLVFKIPSSSLDLGQYWVDISVPDCYASNTLTFDILEEGALYASGTLQKIIVEPWANIGDIVPIHANFKNTGEKALEARFEGKIMYKNKIVQLIESDEPLFVPIDSSDNFQFYFTPKSAGQYTISGRVFYDSKRTYEQSSILNVRPNSSLTPILKWTSYIILVIIISTLLYLIRKERRSYFKLKSRR